MQIALYITFSFIFSFSFVKQYKRKHFSFFHMDILFYLSFYLLSLLSNITLVVKFLFKKKNRQKFPSFSSDSLTSSLAISSPRPPFKMPKVSSIKKEIKTCLNQSLTTTPVILAIGILWENGKNIGGTKIQQKRKSNINLNYFWHNPVRGFLIPRRNFKWGKITDLQTFFYTENRKNIKLKERKKYRQALCRQNKDPSI